MYATRRPPAEPDETAVPRLSAREFEVLSWLARGKSGGEIGLILGIRVPTVRIHIRNIFRKLEAVNIPHAVARAFLCGIL
ncbi:MAG TPA: helix-turn-helix transcriptional regulator [Gemmatimonadaceae bacterium]|nr:helix-turn-helix transcriptional regulator [Gemmatimonadaceae bacterium]